MAWSDRRKRFVRRSSVGLLSLLILGLIASWIIGGILVAPRLRSIGRPPADFPAASISLPSDSGSTLSGWHIRSRARRGALVLLHGIRESRLSMLSRARLLRSAGYSIVTIDLQAHGESPGEHITIGHLERHDARAAVEFARREHPGEPIGVVGVSLGGAAALLATPLPIDALVLESVFPDLRNAVCNRVAAKLGPLASIPAALLLAQLRPRLGISSEELRPIDHVADVGCPVFFISGTEDVHTTATETSAMFSAALEPKELWLVEGAAHEDLLRIAPEDYKKRVLGFLDRHLSAKH